MVLHANFFSLGSPEISDLQTAPTKTVARVLAEALSICSVNAFIFISGYFGIHPKRSSLTRYLFQIVFLFGLIYGFCLFAGTATWSVQGFLQCICLSPQNWFVKAYLLLYIMAPALNAFADKQDCKLHRNVLVGFFLIQTFYGCLFAADFFEKGYGTLSFMGLYLLVRYIKLYRPKWSLLKKEHDLLIYLFCAVSITGVTVWGIMAGKNTDILMFTYINPLVIIESVTLFLFFSKLSFTSRLINWVASSSFAVYLVHTNPNILGPVFKKQIVCLNESTNSIKALVLVFIFLVLTFSASVLLDQIRKFAHEFIFKEIHNR